MDDVSGSGSPPFLADDPALDFLNSRMGPAGQGVEWIGDGGDLVSWLGAAGLLPPEAAVAMRAAPRPAGDAAAAAARDLREWLRDVLLRGELPPRPGAFGHLNAVLDGDQRFLRIDGDPPGLREVRRWSAPIDLLHPIAEAMARLLVEVDPSQVRPCQGVGCTRWFRDTSKNQGRRWCSMAVCGNRAKAAQHRARLREGS